MRVSLQIDGDASGAVKAASDTGSAIDDLGKQTAAISKAIEDGFKGAISTIDKLKQGSESAGAANDNNANAALGLANRLAQVASAAAGADSALAKGAAGAVSFAKGLGEAIKAVGAFNVVGAVLGLAVTAANTFYSVVNSGSKDSEERVQEHARLVGILRGAYQDAAGDVEQFGQKVSAVTRFQSERSLDRLRADLARLSSSAVDRSTSIPSQGLSDVPLPAETPGAIPQVPQVRPEFEAFAGAIKKFEAGDAASITAAREEIANIGRAAAAANPELAALAEQFLNGTEQAGKVAEAITTLSDALQGKFKGATQSSTGEFDRLEKSMRRQAAAQEAEAAAAGKSVGEAARLRAEFVLGEAAGGKYADKIAAIAARYGEAAQKAASARLQSDAYFERAQLGRNSDEATLAAQLRGAFGDSADLNSDIANMIRANNEMRELKATTQDLASGAVSNLRQQVQALGFTWEAAGNVALNVIDRLIDKLASKQLDSLISNIFGSLLGGGSIAVGDYMMPKVGYDTGGYTGSGGKYQVAGVVHKEEFVFDQDATRRIGVSNLERLRRGGLPGYAGGGYVGAAQAWGSPGGAPAPSSQASAPASLPVMVENTYNLIGAVGKEDITRMIASANQQSAQQILRIVDEQAPGRERQRQLLGN